MFVVPCLHFKRNMWMRNGSFENVLNPRYSSSFPSSTNLYNFLAFELASSPTPTWSRGNMIVTSLWVSYIKRFMTSRKSGELSTLVFLLKMCHSHHTVILQYLAWSHLRSNNCTLYLYQTKNDDNTLSRIHYYTVKSWSNYSFCILS